VPKNKIFTPERVMSGQTRVMGVVGYPVAHSLSPVFQNAALRYLGLDAVYCPFAVPPTRLRAFFALMQDTQCVGLNITVPHKERAVALVDTLDPDAQAAGAVNTVCFKDRKTVGYNTDAAGACQALGGRKILAGKHLLILGSGGAARALAVGAIRHGIARISLANRTRARRQKLIRDLRCLSAVDLDGWSLEHPGIKTLASQADVIVNATTLGMGAKDAMPLGAADLPRKKIVMDMVYSRELTPFLSASRLAGNAIVPGWEMLLYQGAAAFTLWTGCAAPIKIMRQALTDYLDRSRWVGPRKIRK
jgi:shikimate dehydrogenase